ACSAGVATSHRAREQFRHLRGNVNLPGSAFPGEEGTRVACTGTHAMEMRITALIVAIGLLLTALHGGWNISDITVLFVVNLGN
ncbi:hypothetical protein, partial [Enterobacter chuandaensis]